jgi:prepilin-type processing-associated H-X9-DG protein
MPDDYDDADDRPRRRPKGDTSSGLVIGLVIAGVAVLGFCGLAILIGLLLPAVQKVRQAASRVTDQNNLKQVALAFHNQESATRKWHAPVAHDDKQVYPGLSFRVALLPYVEAENLYRQFDKAQPWDGATNKPLADQPPRCYVPPPDIGAAGTGTPYRVFAGPGALFDGNPVVFTDIKDGTSNTLLLIHHADRVPFSQPLELPFGPGVSPTVPTVPGLAGGTNVALADGSVRFLRATTTPAALRALVTRTGAEQVMPDW